ncbi:MAG: helix-turn-helix transcriptional regulator [Ilumatobacteraceae bacterium]
MGSGDLLRGHLDGLLLAVLADEPGHGYELARRVATRSHGDLDVPEGSLYPALHRLEQAGFVSSRWAIADGRRRRVYRRTAAGRRRLASWHEERRSFVHAVDRVLGVAT